MKNKYEVINRSQLKVGDVITFISLEDGKVVTDVTVCYTYFAGTDNGFDYNIDNSTARERYGKSTTVPGSKVNAGMVFLRKSSLPANWPPKADDVWKIGGYTWHMMGSSFRRAYGTTSYSAEDVLNRYGNGKAELLFRK